MIDDNSTEGNTKDTSEKEIDSADTTNIHSSTFIGGDVNTGGGDFVGRDKTTLRDIVNSIGVAIGDRAQAIVNIFGDEDVRHLRDRETMLELVKDFWIKGVLEQSLHNEVLIQLGFKELEDNAEHPWNRVVQTTHRHNYPLPSDTKIIDVFDSVERQCLLILGDPGSGKTTTLLELARDIITRAENNFTNPIPVVLNLSSWANSKISFATWLVDELNVKYNVPNKIGRPWIENDDLLLFLDGLDEVSLEHREACVDAMNDFREQHWVSLVVCCRITDYRDLKTPLQAQTVILLEPLTLQQINNYLSNAGSELDTLRNALRQDIALQELAKSPMMLNVMTLAYRGISLEQLQPLATIEDRRKHLFSTYIRQMFQRRGTNTTYTPEQTVLWLAWLAQKMSKHNQTEFLIDQLQPNWLSTRLELWLYTIISRLLGGAAISPVAGALGSVGGIFFGFLDGLRFELSSTDTESETVSTTSYWHRGVNIAKDRIRIGLNNRWIHRLLGGLFVASLFGSTLSFPIWALMSTLRDRIFFASAQGILWGVIFGLVLGLRSQSTSLANDIQTIESFSWSWQKSTKGIVIGLVIGVTFCLVTYLTLGKLMRNVGSYFLFFFISCVFGYSLIGGVVGGFQGKKIEAKTSPHQAMRLAVKNVIISGLTGALISILILGIPAGLNMFLFGDRIIESINAITFKNGLIESNNIDMGYFGKIWSNPSFIIVLILFAFGSFGTISALYYGAFDLIKHVILRSMLALNNKIPFRYAHFLDYATERVFLRKVGDGYIFVHRLLQDYFADLEPAKVLSMDSDTTSKPIVTHQGSDSQDIIPIMGLTIVGVVLWLLGSCGLGFICLPIAPIIMGAIGLTKVKNSVNPKRTKLLSRLNLGCGIVLTLIVILLVGAYVMFIMQVIKNTQP